jgi:hypothetical protein
VSAVISEILPKGCLNVMSENPEKRSSIPMTEKLVGLDLLDVVINKLTAERIGEDSDYNDDQGAQEQARVRRAADVDLRVFAVI